MTCHQYHHRLSALNHPGCLRTALATILVMLLMTGCSCSDEPEPGNGEPETVHASYAIAGTLSSVAAHSEGASISLVDARVWMVADRFGSGSLENGETFEGTVDTEGGFQIETGPLEFEKEAAPKLDALLVATLDGHAVAHRLLHLEPETKPLLDVKLFEYHEMEITEDGAQLEDGSIVVSGLADSIGGGRARLFNPSHEPDAFSGGNDSAGGLLSFGSVAGVVLFGLDGEPITALESPAELRFEIPSSLWSEIELLPPSAGPVPTGALIDPSDCCILRHGITMEPQDPAYESPARIPVLAFDQSSGSWILEAIGKLEREGGEAITYGDLVEGLLDSLDGRLFASASVSHFSQWGYGWPVARGCVKGVVLDENGEEAEGVTITGQLKGHDVVTGPVVTGAEGEFCISSPGTIDDTRQRHMEFFAILDGQRVSLGTFPLGEQVDWVMMCGPDVDCFDLPHPLELPEPGPIAECRVDYLFPEMTWPHGLGGLVLDLEVEIIGSDFGANMEVIWKDGLDDEEILLTLLVEHSERLVVTIPGDRLRRHRHSTNVTLKLKMDGAACGEAVFLIDGVLPDTGQMGCYDAYSEVSCEDLEEHLFGQDSHFGWDLHSPERFFRTDQQRPEEPVVFDYQTQLTWQGCIAGRRGLYCEGDDILMDHADAAAYCESLGEDGYGGYGDRIWRLPEVHELWAIMDHGAVEPMVNSDHFPNTPAREHWSATPVHPHSDLGYNWMTSFLDGYIDGYSSDRELAVRCVTRDQLSPGRLYPSEPQAEADIVVRDTGTGLMWRRCSLGQTGDRCEDGDASMMGWTEALSACRDNGFAGYQDWRLPSVNELMSILDYEAANPAVDEDAFPGAAFAYQEVAHWSSTTLKGGPREAMAVDFSLGFVRASPKTYPMHVLCVRKGP